MARDMELEKLLAVGKEFGLAGDELREWVQKEASAARQERDLVRDAERQRLWLECDILDRKIQLAKKKNLRQAFRELDIEIAELERRLEEKRYELENIELDAREGQGTRVAACEESACQKEEKDFQPPHAEVKGLFEVREHERDKRCVELSKPRADQPPGEERTRKAPSEGKGLPISTLDKFHSQTAIFDVSATAAEALALPCVLREKTRRRVAKLDVQWKGREKGSANVKDADTYICLQALESARTFGRKRKNSCNIPRLLPAKSPLGDVSCNKPCRNVTRMCVRFQIDHEAKGTEWKRRKKVKMKENMRKPDRNPVLTSPGTGLMQLNCMTQKRMVETFCVAALCKDVKC